MCSTIIGHFRAYKIEYEHNLSKQKKLCNWTETELCFLFYQIAMLFANANAKKKWQHNLNSNYESDIVAVVKCNRLKTQNYGSAHKKCICSIPKLAFNCVWIENRLLQRHVMIHNYPVVILGAIDEKRNLQVTSKEEIGNFEFLFDGDCFKQFILFPVAISDAAPAIHTSDGSTLLLRHFFVHFICS